MGAPATPEWTGAGFRLADRVLPVLEYSDNADGWSDELTELHEEAAGDAHPIDVASREDALDQLEAHLGKASACTLLEIGCSSGFMLKSMRRRFPEATLLGADVVREPLYALAKELPGVPLMRFDLTRCPLPSQSCDAVVMLNVLEHIADDVGALAHAYRILRPGGILVVEVPAGPHLFDAYDKALMHFRRYRLRELIEKLRNAGFVVERKSHLGFFVYPAFAAVKRKNQRTFSEGSDLKALVRTQASKSSRSRLLSLAVRFERLLGKRVSYPTGIRCLAVGKKP